MALQLVRHDARPAAIIEDEIVERVLEGPAPPAQLGCDVALKALKQVDATAVARLKNEFRSLAGLSHPNLITLYDLFCDGELWFFTMELIEGGPILPKGGESASTVAPQATVATALIAEPPQADVDATVPVQLDEQSVAMATGGGGGHAGGAPAACAMISIAHA